MYISKNLFLLKNPFWLHTAVTVCKHFFVIFSFPISCDYRINWNELLQIITRIFLLHKLLVFLKKTTIFIFFILWRFPVGKACEIKASIVSIWLCKHFVEYENTKNFYLFLILRKSAISERKRMAKKTVNHSWMHMVKILKIH